MHHMQASELSAVTVDREGVLYGKRFGRARRVSDKVTDAGKNWKRCLPDLFQLSPASGRATCISQRLVRAGDSGESNG